MDLAGDFVYVPYLLADGEQFLSCFAEVNPEDLDHVQSLSQDNFNLKDIVGGDLDFNDLVLIVETISI
ncbi:MAG: hypothetical protein AAGE84_23195 [Cyanobacteria bacterium P01_G01_bin.39]